MKKFGLIPRILLAIVLGSIFGKLTFLPTWILQIPVSISDLFGQILNFIVPLMIAVFVVNGIVSLAERAGRVLGISIVFSYASVLIAGLFAYLVAYNFFPRLVDTSITLNMDEGSSLASFIGIEISPFFSISSGLVFGVAFGLAMAALGRKGKAQTLTQVFADIQDVISQIISGFIIPLLPLYIFGNFVNLSYAGNLGNMFRVFGVVYLFLISEHFIYLLVNLSVGSLATGRSVKETIKNTVPAYVTAFGTQSSVASVPANIQAAKNNGNDEGLADAMIPIMAAIHMPGTMISITNCVMGLLMINGLDYSPAVVIPYLITLSLAFIATPGIPGGGVMASLPYLPMLGIDPGGTIASLLITLYITQDSFGTSINVSSDQGLLPLIEKYAGVSED